MESKRILIIGDGSSFLLHSIVKNINAADTKLTFDLLNTNTRQNIINPDIYNRILNPGKIHLILQKLADKINPYLSFFLMRFYLIRSIKLLTCNYYDYIHIHFFNKNFLYINIETLKRVTKQLIITFWGSDFFKRTNEQRMLMVPYLDFASKIIFSNPNMKDFFINFYNSYNSKCYIVATGLEILNEIDHLENKSINKNILKNEYQIDLNKTVVTVGYSSHPDNRQIEIIDHIVHKLEWDQIQNIFFIFPLTYGDPKYKKEVVKFAKQHKLFFSALTQPLTNEEIAKYRIITDIMIHLRDTDQFSGSFQEHLYAKNVIITGKWLPYQFILSKGIYMHVIDNFNELSSTLSSILENLETEFDKCSNNKTIIGEISHWKNIVDKHILIYN